MKRFLLLVLLVSAGWTHAAPAPTLIPFQGRLTDQVGNAYTNGQYTLIFNLYDQAVGGSVLWTETHQRVGVINGMVNVFLGSINPALTGVDFSQTRYLGITIDPDNNPNTPDPEMVPRQMIIPAFWAKHSENSTKLAGHDWSPVFGTNNPMLPLPATKLANGSLPASKLTPASVTSNQIAPKTVTAAQIADATVSNRLIMDSAVDARVLSPNAVTTDKIINSAVTSAKIATNAVLNVHLAPASVSWDKQTIRTAGSENLVAGQVGMSAVTAGTWISPTPRVYTLVPGLSVNMTCTGRPVSAFLTCKLGGYSQITATRSSGSAYVQVALRRVDLVTNASVLIGELVPVNYNSSSFATSPGMFQFLDVPPAGQFRYEIETRTDSSNGSSVTFVEVQLVAFEL
jgi:hypothetical protein